MSHIVLLPANGISAAAYTPITSSLRKTHTVTTVEYHPLKHPTPAIPKGFTWVSFMQDLQHQIPSNKTGCIGIGHSLGGIMLLMDALIHPKRWQHIVIIEPATFSAGVCRFFQLIRALHVEPWLHPMIRITKHRRETVPSLDSIYKKWRKKKQFQYLSDDALTHYIDGTFIENNGALQLRFPREWEVEVYRTAGTMDGFIWNHLHQLAPKMTVIGAQTSNTFFGKARKQLNAHATHAITLPNTTHLLPFECPEKAAHYIDV